MTDIKNLTLNKEEDRLETFNSWIISAVDKKLLAKYGFYYTGSESAIRCIFCNVLISDWDIGDDPLQEHIYWSPSCPLLLNKANLNIPFDSNFTDH